MIFEFAISPSLCTNYHDLRFFLETFGGENGRLFSDIPRKRWERLARKAIKESSNGQVERKRLIAGIERLIRKAIYRRNSVPTVESELWMDHAIAAHEDRRFQAILTDCYDGNEKCVLLNDYDFTEDDQWIIPLDIAIKRVASDMVQAIQPMLNCAQEVILVDRNFNPEFYRWRPFIIELADFLSRKDFRPSINKIDYHIGNRISADQMELLCNTHILNRMPTGFKINFILWPWDDLHDRYALTDIGGVEFGIGLDIYDGSGSEEVKINRISEGNRTRWWKACKNKPITFTISK